MDLITEVRYESQEEDLTQSVKMQALPTKAIGHISLASLLV